MQSLTIQDDNFTYSRTRKGQNWAGSMVFFQQIVRELLDFSPHMRSDKGLFLLNSQLSDFLVFPTAKLCDLDHR
ncbi:MAG: hypothetical protein AAF298_28255 [Cyanobacteria bacterium P01_A01_bin.40]